MGYLEEKESARRAEAYAMIVGARVFIFLVVTATFWRLMSYSSHAECMERGGNWVSHGCHLQTQAEVSGDE